MCRASWELDFCPFSVVSLLLQELDEEMILDIRYWIPHIRILYPVSNIEYSASSDFKTEE